ncbi:MAG: glutathione S-transferase family protein [Pseudomonadaceae bacterium]
MVIYGDSRSGNCYKLQLLCALQGIDYQWQAVDIMAGETRTDSFLALNPNGKVPTLLLDDGRTLAESNAIMLYLAAGSTLIPTDSYAHARMMQWLFFEQYSHEPYIAVARFIKLYQGMPEARQAEYETRLPGGYRALKVMEQALTGNDYLVDNQLCLADIALYAYTHVAHEGGFLLDDFPAIRCWLQRIQHISGYRPMEA